MYMVNLAQRTIVSARADSSCALSIADGAERIQDAFESLTANDNLPEYCSQISELDDCICDSSFLDEILQAELVTEDTLDTILDAITIGKSCEGIPSALIQCLVEDIDPSLDIFKVVNEELNQAAFVDFLDVRKNHRMANVVFY